MEFYGFSVVMYFVLFFYIALNQTKFTDNADLKPRLVVSRESKSFEKIIRVIIKPIN
jgi:hypothetical protein